MNFSRTGPARLTPFLDIPVLASDGLPLIVRCRTFTKTALGSRRCRHCGEGVPSPHRTYCSTRCSHERLIHHHWNFAREEALRRFEHAGAICRGCQRPWLSARGKDGRGHLHQAALDEYYRLERFGPPGWPARKAIGFFSPEVNHKRPLNGNRQNVSCHHHQANLEALCHDCHLLETAKQRAAGLIGARLV